MDQIKIGRFIAECRKNKNLTQMQLAERLNITDRAVSKWENGKSMPDSAIMLDLCHELGISVNDLLYGEVVSMENYNEKNEQQILELINQKETSDRMLLRLEILIGVLSVVILLIPVFIAAFVDMEDWLRIVLIVVGAILGFIGIFFALKIEQVAGYYECNHCHHKYVPTYKAVNLAMHMGRTRYMRCPECGKKSWQKKVINKD
jgi:transcriptional regulator with XRE-family HTH domain